MASEQTTPRTAEEAGALDVASLELRYTDVLNDRIPAAARAEVRATVTSDSALAEAKRDRDVEADAAHADAIQAMRQASTSYAQGNREQAAQFLGEAKARLSKAMQQFGAREDLAKAAPELQAFEGALAAPPASPEASRAAKRLHNFSYEER